MGEAKKCITTYFVVEGAFRERPWVFSPANLNWNLGSTTNYLEP